jgi:hypothetical protein
MGNLEKVFSVKGLRLPEEIHRSIKAAANTSCRTMTQQIRQYIIQGVENERQSNLVARVEMIEKELMDLRRHILETDAKNPC